MDIEETLSTIKITKASANFFRTIDKLPWDLFFWEATIITNEIFKTKIESNGIIDKNEVISMVENCSKELTKEENNNDKIYFTLYFIKR